MEQEINLAMSIFNGISLIGQLREESFFQKFSSGTLIKQLGQQETYVIRRPLEINGVLETNCGFLVLI
jgi:hypothetical protein